jgi:hypothetical protein
MEINLAREEYVHPISVKTTATATATATSLGPSYSYDNGTWKIFVQNYNQTNKKPSWPLVHNRYIPTERPPLVGEVSANFFG